MVSSHALVDGGWQRIHAAHNHHTIYAVQLFISVYFFLLALTVRSACHIIFKTTLQRSNDCARSAATIPSQANDERNGMDLSGDWQTNRSVLTGLCLNIVWNSEIAFGCFMRNFEYDRRRFKASTQKK